MSTESKQVEEYWRRAAAELGIHAIIPFTLRHGAEAIACTALITGFGRPNGVVVIAGFSGSEPAVFKRFQESARANGMLSSYMRLSREYDLSEFRDALIDWGYCGPAGDRPASLDN